MGQNEVQCERCCGNGETVTDWDAYLDPPERAPGDSGTEACRDCDGTGQVTRNEHQGMMTIIDAIRRDRDTGTPGPWVGDDDGEVCMDDDVAAWVCCVNFDNVADEQALADLRRIARLPDVEAVLLAHAAALAETRDLLREGCDLLADEHETLKISITMADGTLSANPLDAWSVEKVKAMDDWIMRAGRACLSNDSTS